MKQHRKARGLYYPPSLWSQVASSTRLGATYGLKKIFLLGIPTLALGGLSVDRQTPAVVACEIGFGAMTAVLGWRAMRKTPQRFAFCLDHGCSMSTVKAMYADYPKAIESAPVGQRAKSLGKLAAVASLSVLLATGGYLFHEGRSIERSQPSTHSDIGAF
jgi:hypothetical protein